MLQWWFTLSKSVRFLGIGLFNTTYSYISFVILLYVFGEQHYQLLLLANWSYTSFISFSTQKYFVFHTHGFWWREYIACLGVWGCSYLLNALILALGKNTTPLPLEILQLISLCLTTICTYISFEFWIFRRTIK